MPRPPDAARPIDLLVVGDANPDLVLYGGDVTPVFGQHERIVDHAALVLGGSGSITAVGAARLGLRTAMAGAVGDDVLGRFVLAELAAAGVDTAAVRVLAGTPTGISVALARPDDRAVLTARGALAAFDPAAVPDDLLARARHVHVASPFLQPALRDGLPVLIRRAHAAGATVSVDTGWDPAARWQPVAAALAFADLLLPNAQEAVRLAGALEAPDSPVADEVAAARILGGHGALVVVKRGPDGAVAVHGGAVSAHPGFVVEAVDATGAGDSFDAGFLAAWLGGADLAAALAFGCACGALSTRYAGGTGGQPTRARAEKFLEEVT